MRQWGGRNETWYETGLGRGTALPKLVSPGCPVGSLLVDMRFAESWGVCLSRLVLLLQGCLGTGKGSERHLVWVWDLADGGRLSPVVKCRTFRLLNREVFLDGIDGTVILEALFQRLTTTLPLSRGRSQRGC